MIRSCLVILIVSVILFLAGCAQVRFPVQMPDGSIVMGEYTRWGNQKIEGFRLKTPEGWEISFDQESEFEAGFKFGVINASIGNNQ